MQPLQNQPPIRNLFASPSPQSRPESPPPVVTELALPPAGFAADAASRVRAVTPERRGAGPASPLPTSPASPMGPPALQRPSAYPSFAAYLDSRSGSGLGFASPTLPASPGGTPALQRLSAPHSLAAYLGSGWGSGAGLTSPTRLASPASPYLQPPVHSSPTTLGSGSGSGSGAGYSSPASPGGPPALQRLSAPLSLAAYLGSGSGAGLTSPTRLASPASPYLQPPVHSSPTTLGSGSGSGSGAGYSSPASPGGPPALQRLSAHPSLAAYLGSGSGSGADFTSPTSPASPVRSPIQVRRVRAVTPLQSTPALGSGAGAGAGFTLPISPYRTSALSLTAHLGSGSGAGFALSSPRRPLSQLSSGASNPSHSGPTGVAELPSLAPHQGTDGMAQQELFPSNSGDQNSAEAVAHELPPPAALKVPPTPTKMRMPSRLPHLPGAPQLSNAHKRKLGEGSEESQAKRAKIGSTFADRRLTPFSSAGAMKEVFTFAEGEKPLFDGRRNEELVVKININKEREDKQLAWECHQYAQLRGRVPLAAILNDPVRDKAIVQEKIIAHPTLRLNEMVNRWSQIRSEDEIASLPPEDLKMLAQLQHFFRVGVEMQTPIDLSNTGNLIINLAGVAVLHDFHPEEEDYTDDYLPVLFKGLECFSGGNIPRSHNPFAPRGNPVMQRYLFRAVLAEANNSQNPSRHLFHVASARFESYLVEKYGGNGPGARAAGAGSGSGSGSGAGAGFAVPS